MTLTTIILTAAKVAKVSGPLLLAICMQESNLQNVIAPDDGGTPSYGICQVKLGTAQMLGYTGNGQGLMVPEENAKWAAEYLRYQKERYEHDWCKAVAAYNAGRYNPSTKSPGYPKNLKYVRKVQEKLKIDLQPRLACVNKQHNDISNIIDFKWAVNEDPPGYLLMNWKSK